jgi:hypothetical protein
MGDPLCKAAWLGVDLVTFLATFYAALGTNHRAVQALGQGVWVFVETELHVHTIQPLFFQHPGIVQTEVISPGASIEMQRREAGQWYAKRPAHAMQVRSTDSEDRAAGPNIDVTEHYKPHELEYSNNGM